MDGANDGKHRAATATPPREETPRDRVIADLMALVAALDLRVPHIERDGETRIAEDAAALRARAMERLSALTDPAGQR